MANRASIRFQNVAIAKDATIESCYARLWASNTDSYTTVTLTLGFNAADDPAAPVSAVQLAALTMTAATVAWSPGQWVAGQEYLTPDLKSSLQEIVSRAGWVTGQDVILIFEDNASTTWAYRRFYSYDYDGGSKKPSLFVTYTE